MPALGERWAADRCLCWRRACSLTVKPPSALTAKQAQDRRPALRVLRDLCERMCSVFCVSCVPWGIPARVRSRRERLAGRRPRWRRACFPTDERWPASAAKQSGWTARCVPVLPLREEMCPLFCVMGHSALCPFPQGKGRRLGSPAGGEFTFRQLVLGRHRLRSSWAVCPPCPTLANLGVLGERMCSVSSVSLS